MHTITHKNTTVKHSDQYSKKIVFDAIPNELRNKKRWIGWYAKDNGDGTFTKPPRTIAPGKTQIYNEKNQSSLDVARMAMYQRNWSGVGFVLMYNDNITALDFDGCVLPDGSLEPSVQRVVDAINSYTEYSISGKGIHIFAKGHVPTSGRMKDNIEVYTEKRYLTISGMHVPGTPEQLQYREEPLCQWFWENFPENTDNTPAVKNTRAKKGPSAMKNKSIQSTQTFSDISVNMQEPPVYISDEYLDLWYGKSNVQKEDKVKNTMKVDRSDTLYLIGKALCLGGATKSGIVTAIAERDHTLGLDKYTDRTNRGMLEYQRIANNVFKKIAKDKKAELQRQSPDAPAIQCSVHPDATLHVHKVITCADCKTTIHSEVFAEEQNKSTKSEYTTKKETEAKVLDIDDHTPLDNSTQQKATEHELEERYNTLKKKTQQEQKVRSNPYLGSTEANVLLTVTKLQTSAKSRGLIQDETETIKFSLKDFSKTAGCSDSTSSRSLEKLEKMQLITIKRTRDDHYTPINGKLIRLQRISVGLRDTLENTLEAAATIQPDRPRQGGNRTYCSDHPQAKIVHTRTSSCSICGTILEQTKIESPSGYYNAPARHSNIYGKPQENIDYEYEAFIAETKNYSDNEKAERWYGRLPQQDAERSNENFHLAQNVLQ